MAYYYTEDNDGQSGRHFKRIPNLYVEHFTLTNLWDIYVDSDYHMPIEFDGGSGFYFCWGQIGSLPNSEWFGPYLTEGQALDRAHLTYKAIKDEPVEELRTQVELLEEVVRLIVDIKTTMTKNRRKNWTPVMWTKYYKAPHIPYSHDLYYYPT